MLDDVPNKYGQYLQIPGGCENRLEHARGGKRNEALDLASCRILEDRTSRIRRIRLDQSSSRDELLKCMQLEDASITEEQIKSLVDLMDKNKDGAASKKEFLYRYTLNRERFTAVDTGQSGGNVSLSELSAFIQKERRQYCFFHKKYYDKTATEKEMCLLLERMGTSQDGKVSKNELHTHTHTHTHLPTDSLTHTYVYIHTFPCGT
jgi:Ca2+-binding EF-hand superfamily protein